MRGIIQQSVPREQVIFYLNWWKPHQHLSL
ncbi:hypothetical protein VPHD239_0065 [Vibrio phage D239]